VVEPDADNDEVRAPHSDDRDREEEVSHGKAGRRHKVLIVVVRFSTIGIHSARYGGHFLRRKRRPVLEETSRKIHRVA